MEQITNSEILNCLKHIPTNNKCMWEVIEVQNYYVCTLRYENSNTKTKARHLESVAIENKKNKIEVFIHVLENKFGYRRSSDTIVTYIEFSEYDVYPNLAELYDEDVKFQLMASMSEEEMFFLEVYQILKTKIVSE